VITRRNATITGIGKVEAIRRNFGKFHAGDPASTPEEIQDALNNLSGHLVRRFQMPQGIKRLYVAPEDCIGFVPFTLLFPGREIVYEPSATTYGMLLAESDLHGEKILALGDPDYSTTPAFDSTRTGERGKRLAALPGTRDEAKAVGDVVLLGKEASEAGFRAAIAAQKGRRLRAVHFACHGLVDSEHPARSCLALTPSGNDDGYLTVGEIGRSKVAADLAVLSACDTGKGVLVRSEGLLGLPRAFMQAGTPRVLCSLWQVDDQATRALMTKFYERWKAGDAAVTALGAAQEFVRSQEKWKHPHYWAAWVLWGLPK
jgi:CHAT domain-containing protein